MSMPQDPPTNRSWILKQRPSGSLQGTDFALIESPGAPLADGTARVRVNLLSIDPLIRKWLDEGPAAVPIDSLIRGLGVGQVIESRSGTYAVGDLVVGMTGWQEYVIVGTGAASLQVVPAELGAADALDLYGFNWVTAYFGMTEIGRPAEGDVVVVSAAAGATGSIAGQIAKIRGATVIGIAGGPRKCSWLVDELGFDAAIDHRLPDFQARLAGGCPDGIDLYWDNVGGAVLDAVITQLAAHARVVLCGAVSTFDTAHDRQPGLRNYPDLITKRVRMEGFGVTDYLPRFAEARSRLAAWSSEGLLRHTQYVTEGLPSAPDALRGVLAGENLGKTVVAVRDPSRAVDPVTQDA